MKQCQRVTEREKERLQPLQSKRAVERRERAVSVATGSLLSAISQYSELIWSLSHQCSLHAGECIRTINTDYILSLCPPWHMILNISPDQLLMSWIVLNSPATGSSRYRYSQTSNFSDFISSILSDSISTFDFYWKRFQNSCARCGLCKCFSVSKNNELHFNPIEAWSMRERKWLGEIQRQE